MQGGGDRGRHRWARSPGAGPSGAGRGWLRAEARGPEGATLTPLNTPCPFPFRPTTPPTELRVRARAPGLASPLQPRLCGVSQGWSPRGLTRRRSGSRRAASGERARRRGSCRRPAPLRAGARRLPPIQAGKTAARAREPSSRRCRDRERGRGGGVRTALAALEAAAVPPGACDPEAARQADSASLPGSLLSLPSLSLSLPSLAPRSSDAA